MPLSRPLLAAWACGFACTAAPPAPADESPRGPPFTLAVTRKPGATGVEVSVERRAGWPYPVRLSVRTPGGTRLADEQLAASERTTTLALESAALIAGEVFVIADSRGPGAGAHAVLRLGPEAAPVARAAPPVGPAVTIHGRALGRAVRIHD